MAQRGNCFVKCRDEYLGLPGVFPALRAGRKKKYLFIVVQWQDETLSNAWNITEKFVKDDQWISPKRVDIEKKDGGLFTKE